MTSSTLSASKPFAHGLSQPAFPSAWLHPREASSSPARISALDASGAQGWAQTEAPCPSAPGLRHSPRITTYTVSPSSTGPSSRHYPQSYLLCSLEFKHGKEITYIFRPWPLGWQASLDRLCSPSPPSNRWGSSQAEYSTTSLTTAHLLLATITSLTGGPNTWDPGLSPWSLLPSFGVTLAYNWSDLCPSSFRQPPVTLSETSATGSHLCPDLPADSPRAPSFPHTRLGV